MIGIYKFTNNINNKSYIGQSISLENRYKHHVKNCLNKNHLSYNSLFYRALRKYGLESFSYEVLIESLELNKEDLNFLEIYYIEKYSSFGNGYNMNKGGNFTSGVKILTDSDILQIKDRLFNTSETFIFIAKDFNISSSLITMINQGTIWSIVGSREFPIREKENMIHNRGGNNPNCKIDDKKALELRTLFIDNTLLEVYSKNKNLLSLSGLKKLLYGVTFNHLPIYKKREKKWFLDGTCIDYPRLEE